MKLKYGPYSPSRLDTATCGYAFYRQYVDPDRSLKRTEGLAQARGSAVHEVLGEITARLCQNPNAVFSGAEVRQWAAEAIGRHPAAYQETNAILEMAKLYIERPPKILTQDAEVEEMLAIKLEDGKFVECGYDDPDAYARGRADIKLISDDTTFALVYDHKTQPNIEEADTFQLGFYAWVISRSYPFLSEIKTVLHFARYGYYSEPYVWTREDIDRIEDEVMTRIAVIENRTSWEPTPHKNCQYCPFLSECPAMESFVEVGPGGGLVIKPGSTRILGDPNKATEVAGAINILEELTKRLKEELKSFAEKYEVKVAIPGKVYGFVKDASKIDWDEANKSQRAKIYAIFEKHKVDPKPFMAFNSECSGKIWRAENEALVKDLAAVLKRKETTSFRSVKG